MPWSTSDVDKHKKGLSQDQKVKWVRIANRVLKEEDDEGLAVKVANSKTSSGSGR